MNAQEYCNVIYMYSIISMLQFLLQHHNFPIIFTRTQEKKRSDKLVLILWYHFLGTAKFGTYFQSSRKNHGQGSLCINTLNHLCLLIPEYFSRILLPSLLIESNQKASTLGYISHSFVRLISFTSNSQSANSQSAQCSQRNFPRYTK